MTSGRLAATVVLAALAAGTAACGRSTSTSQGSSPAVARSEAPGPDAYEVPCSMLCDGTTRAASLPALCDAVSAKLGPDARCQARKPFGAVVDGTFAVKDGAVLDVTSSSGRTALLALGTHTGWVVARDLGAIKGGALQVVATRPVDIVGLEPAAFQVRVAVVDGSDSTERLFACGLNGEGVVRCPLALLVAHRTAPQPVAAGVAGALEGGEVLGHGDSAWLVDVDLTPQGYVATSVKGQAPRGLVGEHGWVR